MGARFAVEARRRQVAEPRDAVGEARKDFETQRAGLANDYNEAQSQLQSKTAEQQSLERYASQYGNYIESLTR